MSPWQKKEVRGLVSSHPIQYPSDINGWSQSLNNNDLYFQQITFDCLASECSGDNYSIEDKQEIKIGVWLVANKKNKYTPEETYARKHGLYTSGVFVF